MRIDSVTSPINRVQVGAAIEPAPETGLNRINPVALPLGCGDGTQRQVC